MVCGMQGQAKWPAVGVVVFYCRGILIYYNFINESNQIFNFIVGPGVLHCAGPGSGTAHLKGLYL